jgi:hypothetical protein
MATTTASEKSKDTTNATSGDLSINGMLTEDQAAILASVISLTSLFSTAVEALTLIHPSAPSPPQKLALTRLGLQQGRLLIFGDAVGISSPPATIATHFVPSHAGLTNPDPSAPINFNMRDPRLDEEETRKAVEACLDQIVGRPEKLGREEMMSEYGLRPPKKFGAGVPPSGEQAVDLNRLEAFREKYALLQDLSHKRARIQMPRRGKSITMQHWSVKDVEKFNAFIGMVKGQVDRLIGLLGVEEQVERGMKIDIKSLGWHPDFSGVMMKRDWAKLKLIREACESEYPQYLQATDTALRYINQELKGKAKLPLNFLTEEDKEKKVEEKRPGLWSTFKSGSFMGKKKKNHGRSESASAATSPIDEPPRSMSEDVTKDSKGDLGPVRSKSLSAMQEKSPLNIDSVLLKCTTNDSTATTPLAHDDPLLANRLMHADTANSLVDRHDMWQGPGRVPTKDIRWEAHKNAEH